MFGYFFNPNNVLFSISNTLRQLFPLLCHLFPTPRVKYFRYLVSFISDTSCQVFPIPCVKCGGGCVAESSVPVLALPPIQYSCDPTAADLVLMVVRRCRCRASPGDPPRHLGEPAGPSGGARAPPSSRAGTLRRLSLPSITSPPRDSHTQQLRACGFRERQR